MRRPNELGVRLLDALDQPLARLALWFDWVAVDGRLDARTSDLAVDYRRRTTAATIDASDGTSGTINQALPAFTAIDWNNDGVREEQGLKTSTSEAWRYVDARTGAIAWPTTPLTLRYEWIHVGDGVLWSLTNDAASGAGLLLTVVGGMVHWEHRNGSGAESSEVAVSVGDRCSARALLYPDGSVQLGLVIGDASELDGGQSDPLLPATDYAAGSKVRINEVGDTSRGVQVARLCQVFGGLWSRAEISTLVPPQPKTPMLSSGLDLRSVTTSQTLHPTALHTLYEADAVAGDITLTLDPMASWATRAVTIKKITGRNQVIVAAATGEAIDGQPWVILTDNDEYITVASNGGTGRVIT